MQPNYIDFLRRFKPVNTSAEKHPVGQPRKKPVDQPFITDCTRLTIARAIAISDLVCLIKLLKINYLIDTHACLQFLLKNLNFDTFFQLTS